jgi:ribosomal protein L21E
MKEVIIKKGSPELKAFITDISYRLKQGEVVPVNLEGTIFEVSLDSKTKKLSVIPKQLKFQTLSSGMSFII